MKLIRTQDAVGHVLCHDMTQIIVGVTKDEAAEILCNAAQNDHMERSEVKEGKIELKATCEGLLQVDVERLLRINSLGEVMIATQGRGIGTFQCLIVDCQPFVLACLLLCCCILYECGNM